MTYCKVFSQHEEQSCRGVTLLSVYQSNVILGSPVPVCAVCFYCLDSHRPWGSPQDRARGGWARWPACGSVAPHTDSGSGVGDSASSFSASWTDGHD